MPSEEDKTNFFVLYFIILCFSLSYVYSQIKIYFSNNNLIELIKEWSYDFESSKINERKICKELSNYLCDKGYKVHREYRDKDNTIDLVIYLDNFGGWGDNRINIEVKYNLFRKCQFDRMKGQLDGMKKCNGRNILLIFGKLDCNMSNRIEEIIDDNLTIIKNNKVYNSIVLPSSPVRIEIDEADM